jgi:hypothetical protein
MIDLRDGLRDVARSALPKTHTSPDAPRLEWRTIEASGAAQGAKSLLTACALRAPYELLDGPSMLLPTVRAPVEVGPLVLALGGVPRAQQRTWASWENSRVAERRSGITGCGDSAIVAAMFASGIESGVILERFARFPETRLYRQMLRAYAASRCTRRGGKGDYFHSSQLAILGGDGIAVLPRSIAHDVIGYFVPDDTELERLPPRLSICAADLAAGRLVSFTFGSLHAALSAVCAPLKLRRARGSSPSFSSAPNMSSETSRRRASSRFARTRSFTRS